jgi:hypothetical protein
MSGRTVGHLSRSHPLAEVAGRHCAGHLGSLRHSAIGQVACGECWERAIRDDERVAVEFGLATEPPDPAYIDEIAVERACRYGDRVSLTAAERAEAVRRLHAGGMGVGAIGEQLAIAGTKVLDILAGLAAAIPLVPVPVHEEPSEVAS